MALGNENGRYLSHGSGVIRLKKGKIERGEEWQIQSDSNDIWIIAGTSAEQGYILPNSAAEYGPLISSAEKSKNRWMFQ